MTTSKNVAKALLRGKLPTREIAGLVYNEVDLQGPVVMQTPPPIASVEIAAKKSWIKAAVAVMSKVPEYRGAYIMNHKSKNLKAMYVQHGGDPATLHQLHEYATRDGVQSEMWAEKVDLDWLSAWTRTADVPVETWHVLGRRLMLAGRYETIAKCIPNQRHAREEFLGAAFEACVKENDIAAMDTWLSSLRSNKIRLEAIWGGWSMLDGMVNHTMMHVFRTHHKDGAAVLRRIEQNCTPATPTSGEIGVELLEYLPAGSLRVIDGEYLQNHMSLALRLADCDTVCRMIGELLDNCNGDLSETNAIIGQHAVLEVMLEALQRFEPTGEEEGVRGIFDQYQRELSPAATYQALRFGSDCETWAWLTSCGANQPTEDMFHKLVENPGCAFLHGGVPVVVGKPIQWETFIACDGLERVNALLQLPFVDVVIETMGSPATALLLAGAEAEVDGAYAWHSPDTIVSNYMAGRFTEAFGEHIDAWRGALQIVATSTQPLGRTLRGIAILYRNTGSNLP